MRHAITLNSAASIAKAYIWLDRAAELAWRVTFAEPKRSDAQNDRLWEMLGRISKRMDINGRKFRDYQWKCIFMHEMGRQAEVLPSLNGTSWFPSGFKSSDLSVGEMSDMQTFMESWCAEKGVDIWENEVAA